MFSEDLLRAFGTVTFPNMFNFYSKFLRISKGWTDKTSKKKGEEINLVTEEGSSKKNEKNKTKK